MAQIGEYLDKMSAFGARFPHRVLCLHEGLLTGLVCNLIAKLTGHDKEYRLLVQSLLLILLSPLLMLIVLTLLNGVEILLCTDQMHSRWSQFMAKPLEKRQFLSVIQMLAYAASLLPVLGFMLGLAKPSTQEREAVIYGMAHIGAFILSTGLVTDTVGFVVKREELPYSGLDWILLSVHGFGIAALHFINNLAIISLVSAVLSIFARLLPRKPEGIAQAEPAYATIRHHNGSDQSKG